MGRVFPQLGGDRRKSIEFRRLKSISDGPDLIIAGLCDRGPTSSAMVSVIGALVSKKKTQLGSTPD
jgi:hypothetical protein